MNEKVLFVSVIIPCRNKEKFIGKCLDSLIEHYIPLSEIKGNNGKLDHFLNHYNDFKYVAENTIKWYKKVFDKMIFEDFENLIREITDY